MKPTRLACWFLFLLGGLLGFAWVAGLIPRSLGCLGFGVAIAVSLIEIVLELRKSKHGQTAVSVESPKPEGRPIFRLLAALIGLATIPCVVGCVMAILEGQWEVAAMFLVPAVTLGGTMMVFAITGKFRRIL